MEANKIKINKINQNIQRLVATSLSIIIFGMSGGCVKNENNKGNLLNHNHSTSKLSDNNVSKSDYILISNTDKDLKKKIKLISSTYETNATTVPSAQATTTTTITYKTKTTMVPSSQATTATTSNSTTTSSTQSKLDYIKANCELHPLSDENITFYVDKIKGIIYVITSDDCIREYADLILDDESFYSNEEEPYYYISSTKLDYIKANCERHSSSSESCLVYVDKKNRIVYVIASKGYIRKYNDMDLDNGSSNSSEEETTYDTTTTNSAKTQPTQSEFGYTINNCDVYEENGDTIVFIDKSTGEIYVAYNGMIVNKFPNAMVYEGSLKADPIETDYGTTTETDSTALASTTNTTTNSYYVSDTDVKTLTKKR